MTPVNLKAQVSHAEARRTAGRGADFGVRGFQFADHLVQNRGELVGVTHRIQQRLVALADGVPIAAVEERIVERPVVFPPELAECGLALAHHVTHPLRRERRGGHGPVVGAQVHLAEVAALDVNQVVAIGRELEGTHAAAAGQPLKAVALEVGADDIPAIDVKHEPVLLIEAQVAAPFGAEPFHPAMDFDQVHVHVGHAFRRLVFAVVVLGSVFGRHQRQDIEARLAAIRVEQQILAIRREHRRIVVAGQAGHVGFLARRHVAQVHVGVGKALGALAVGKPLHVRRPGVGRISFEAVLAREVEDLGDGLGG